MPINIKLLEVYNIIELTYIGKVTNEELEHSVHEAAKLSLEKDSRLVLADCTHMTEGHTVFDLYFIVPLLKKYKLRPDFIEAIVYPLAPAMFQLASFFETVLINNGIKGKAFKERKDAISWLLENQHAE
jgi:hypothetical protein